MEKLRVALVDDNADVHLLVDRLLSRSRDCTLVGQAYDGAAALGLVELVKPHILLMDLMMPRMSGIEAARELRKTHPELRVIALSASDEYEHIRAMLEAGASGYIVKSALTDDLLSTITAVHSGQRVFSPQVIDRLLNPPRTALNFGLTDREREVLRLMASGAGNTEIAARLSVPLHTINFHQANILHKLDAGSRSEALLLAARAGLI